ncbi:hypothetical protein FJV83_31435 [Mesorhizobium sp. WSM4307]|uniref:RES domain-containing protein n=1 Tax=unclassified Mesorhizobium TaxID=325217 RepID=UPI00115CEE42|nr:MULTISPECIES: RES domain-containing protein [unclassified Mesorhizobium]TRC72039.1 hypothetical protein FJV81_30395 [Mesorhizobium sp. WSM4315]TRC77815.1 hypothetical protein FJV83_31435 [Mesorhizobium sp. WSM4307]
MIAIAINAAYWGAFSGSASTMNVCYKCIGDSYLREEIRTDGKRAKCAYCEKLRKSFTIDELSDRVRSVVEEHYRHHQDEYGADSGEPIKWLIADLLEADETIAEDVRGRISEDTAYEAYDSGDSDPFGWEACYLEKSPDTFDYQETWSLFRREIRTRSRFFSEYARTALADIFGGLLDMKTWEGESVIATITPTSEHRFVYRARIALAEDEITKILTEPVPELGPPPSRFARPGRMNASGISVFYGAFEEDTCIAELRAPVGSHVVLGRFEVVRELRLLDLNKLTTVYTRVSMFDPAFSSMSGRAAFLEQLVEEISRPILPRDEEAEYLVTQAVSEYLASNVEPRIDGILYNSAQTAKKGRNIVLFHHSSVVEPYVLPPGTKVEVNLGWASRDDYDDQIFVWEETPMPPAPVPPRSPPLAPPKPANAPSFPLFPLVTEDSRAEWISDHPALRLLVSEIAVFRIKGVNYDRQPRFAMRHRTTESDGGALFMGPKVRYFAYGSNMYPPRLRFRVPGCQVLGTATLVGHQLRFHKKSRDDSTKCDAYYTGVPTDTVVGVVYEIPKSQKAALDKAEGVGHGYDEVTVALVRSDGTTVEATTYIAAEAAIDPDCKPYTWYRDFVRLGAEEHEFPDAYIKDFILGVDAVADPDEKREEARRAEVKVDRFPF